MDVKMMIVQGRPHGKFLSFPQGEFVFGRGPECHVRPNSPWVSRQHCMLCVAEDHIEIRDLGSSNGTLVNGVRVLDGRQLEDGDKVQIGPLVLQVLLNHPSDQVHLDTPRNRDTGEFILDTATVNENNP
jgi:pSer/pThr/pTyr-binding forkhead associated (FHA) protein